MGRIFEVRKHTMFARWNRMAKAFAKIGKDVTIAVRAGGNDPASNPALRRVIQNARAVNMPKDKVDSAIKRASGRDATDYSEAIYEGYAPHGVAVLVETATNNPTRTVANVRNIFTKHDGNMASTGSVSFMFRKLGVLSYDAGADEDAITEAAIEAGADDVVVYPEDGAIDVLTSPDAFLSVKEAMEAAGLAPGHAEITMRADNDIAVDAELAPQVVKLLDMLEDLDDVQAVYSNADYGALA